LLRPVSIDEVNAQWLLLKNGSMSAPMRRLFEHGGQNNESRTRPGGN
jgi:hypothetical protein